MVSAVSVRAARPSTESTARITEAECSAFRYHLKLKVLRPSGGQRCEQIAAPRRKRPSSCPGAVGGESPIRGDEEELKRIVCAGLERFWSSGVKSWGES